jgi:hypothetical protein
MISATLVAMYALSISLVGAGGILLSSRARGFCSHPTSATTDPSPQEISRKFRQTFGIDRSSDDEEENRSSLFRQQYGIDRRNLQSPSPSPSPLADSPPQAISEDRNYEDGAYLVFRSKYGLDRRYRHRSRSFSRLSCRAPTSPIRVPGSNDGNLGGRDEDYEEYYHEKEEEYDHDNHDKVDNCTTPATNDGDIRDDENLLF